MRIELITAALALAAAGWGASAAAQTIYRCGDSYSQQPCAGGTPVAAEDARSAGQRAQTGAAAKRDAAAADAMEKARLKEEAKPAQAYIPPPKAQDEGKGTEAAKTGKPAVFKASAPAKPGDAKAKKKTKKKTKKAAGTASGARGTGGQQVAHPTNS